MSKQVSLALLSVLLGACAKAPDYSRVVTEFYGYKNDGNVELALNMFADSPSLHFGPLGTIAGLSEIRGILEYDIALNTQLQFQECEAAALEVTCRVIEKNDWLRSVDIESITYDENRFTFSEDGRIETIAATLSAESGKLLGAAMVRFDTWARANRPIDYAELFSQDGAFVYSEENAARVLVLLGQWRTE